ncbi:hypothetical protein B0H14DRAFT_2597398 [Mycena olivaceomarginata]|nr:hypothetical protein B0H14DRAFT_2597398 [Mycena olivaceomarginata]
MHGPNIQKDASRYEILVIWCLQFGMGGANPLDIHGGVSGRWSARVVRKSEGKAYCHLSPTNPHLRKPPGSLPNWFGRERVYGCAAATVMEWVTEELGGTRNPAGYGMSSSCRANEFTPDAPIVECRRKRFGWKSARRVGKGVGAAVLTVLWTLLEAEVVIERLETCRKRRRGCRDGGSGREG